MLHIAGAGQRVWYFDRGFRGIKVGGASMGKDDTTRPTLNPH